MDKTGTRIRLFGLVGPLFALLNGCRVADIENITNSSNEYVAYEYDKYMPGSGEIVTVKKTPGNVVYVTPNGVAHAPQDVERVDREMFRAKYGSASRAFFDFAASRKPKENIDALVMFDTRISWNDIRKSVSGSNGELLRKSSLEQIDLAIQDARKPIVRTLEKLGLTIVSSYRTIPAIIVRGPSEAALLAAHLDGVTLVRGAAPMVAELHAAKNGVTDSSIDTSFNAVDIFGTGQKIGNFEVAEEGISDNHEAFALAALDPVSGYNVTYQIEPRDCSSNADCSPGSRCLALGHAGHAKQCTMLHATKVMSVAAGAVGGVPYGASRAGYYLANRGDGSGGTIQCSLASEIDAYEWFVENGVTTVDESFGCYGMSVPGHTDPLYGGAYGEGTVQDWYARNYDIFIAKAAGNVSEAQPACPYTSNSLCVGSTILGASRMSCTSSWRNNSVFPTGARSDREEPDIVAFGSEGGSCAAPGIAGVDVADPVTSTTAWTQATGTSFAAPQVAALGALCKEAAGGIVDERRVRAIIQVSGFGRNVDGYNYSTPSTNLSLPDWKDGGGAISAPIALGLCGGVVPDPDPTLNSGAWSNPGELDGGSWEYDNVDCVRCNKNNPPFGGLSIRPLSSDAAGSSSRKYVTIDRFDLTEGDRIRYVIAWDSCPEDVLGYGSPPVATDYDLFLVKNSTPVYSSQSVDDTTEGFDVTIPVGGNGSYSVVLGFPEGSAGCNRDGYEPYAAAWITQTP